MPQSAAGTLTVHCLTEVASSFSVPNSARLFEKGGFDYLHARSSTPRGGDPDPKTMAGVPPTEKSPGHHRSIRERYW